MFRRVRAARFGPGPSRERPYVTVQGTLGRVVPRRAGAATGRVHLCKPTGRGMVSTGLRTLTKKNI